MVDIFQTCLKMDLVKILPSKLKKKMTEKEKGTHKIEVQKKKEIKKEKRKILKSIKRDIYLLGLHK